MKKLLPLLAAAVLFSTATIAQDSRSHEDTAWDYIMMKHGQMLEVVHGRTKKITRDVTLVNLTTIHPNGVINDSNGKTKHLKEGEYITMDGRIRKLKDRGNPADTTGGS